MLDRLGAGKLQPQPLPIGDPEADGCEALLLLALQPVLTPPLEEQVSLMGIGKPRGNLFRSAGFLVPDSCLPDPFDLERVVDHEPVPDQPVALRHEYLLSRWCPGRIAEGIRLEKLKT